MMLVAKYAKIFSRTGTQPFNTLIDEGDRHAITNTSVGQQFAAHGGQSASQESYLMDGNMLSGLGHPHFFACQWFGYVSMLGTLWAILGKLLPLTV
jgi:hypothetical protein